MRKIVSLLSVLMLICALAYSQNRTVTGTVVDDKGNPIPFASIIETGTTNGTSSDADGNFRITISQNGKLTISSTGHQSKTVTPDGSSIDVVLLGGAGQMQEVVVTALGFKQSKDRSALSNSVVTGNAVVRSGETNVLTGLSGKAAGVQISRTTGDPGAGAYILIRGQSTITGGTQPLIIVDGVPISNSTIGSGEAGVVQQSRLNDINPSDIESIDVLKGPSAAALWGARASNGVLMITTKKGKRNNKVNITLESTYSVDVLNKSIPLQTNYGQGTSYISATNVWNPNGMFAYGFSRTWGDKISERPGGEDAYITSGDYVILPDGSKRYRIASGTPANPRGGKNSKAVYDHSKELFSNGNFLDNNLSFSGGDAKGNFYLSLGNLQQKGIIKTNSNYTRRSLRFNGSRDFGRLTISGSLAYSYVKSDRIQQGSNLNGIFLGGLRTPPDFFNGFFEGNYVNASGAIFPNRQVSYRNPIGTSTSSGYDNPFWIINRITNTSSVNRFIPTMETNLKLTNWLSVIDRLGIDYYLDSRIENFPVLASGSNNGGYLSEQTISENQINNDFILKGVKKFSKLSVDGLVGFNYNNRNYENVGAYVRNFILPNSPFDLGNSASTSRFPFNSQSTVRVAGTYANFNLGYDEKIFLEMTGRYEWYSTVKNAFFYPSAALAWQFKKADPSGILSFGKLRLSYGQVGVPAPAYAWDTYFGPAAEFESWGPALDASSPTYGGGYSRSSQQGNPGIRPEIKRETEIGTDLRFFANRISLSATYYRNKTTDAILSVQVPSSTGYDSKLDNIGTIQNRGFEIQLDGNWLRKKDFNISSTLIFSRNENLVVNMGGSKSIFLAGFTGSSSRAVEGYSLGALWGVDFQRDSKGNLVLGANGFPQQNANESVIGDPNPDWTASFRTTLNYKGLSFSFLFDRVQGGDVWNGTKGALYTFGTHKDVGNEVVAPSNLKTYNGSTITSGTKFRGAVYDFGSGPVALTESWYTDLGGGFGPVGSQFVEDGTRTRLREISLGYSFAGEKFKRATRLSSIDVLLTGRNLVLWTDYTGIDPETNLTGPTNGRGLDYFNNPSTRSFLFTLRFNY